MQLAFKRKPSFEEQEVNQRKEVHLGWKSLWISGGPCALLATLFYYAAHYYHNRQLVEQIFLYLSTAFIVALILVVALEINARARAQQEFNRHRAELSQYRDTVAKDVFEAVLGRIVPEPMVYEIRQILLTKAIKTQCEYLITFKADEDMPPGYAMLRRDLSFRVINLLDQTIRFPIESDYTSDSDLDLAVWRGRPFHMKLTVDGIEIRPQSAEGSDTKKSLKLEHVIQLEPRGHADVFLRGEEPVRIEAGRSSYVQSTPVDALTISIHNELRDQIQDVNVQMHHPAWRSMETNPDIGRYMLQRAFLPGQGFDVSWKAAPELVLAGTAKVSARSVETLR